MQGLKVPKLLGCWEHGGSGQPGLTHHQDVELSLAQGLSRKKSAVQRALRKRKNPLFHAQTLREFKCKMF